MENKEGVGDELGSPATAVSWAPAAAVDSSAAGPSGGSGGPSSLGLFEGMRLQLEHTRQHIGAMREQCTCPITLVSSPERVRPLWKGWGRGSDQLFLSCPEPMELPEN